MVIVVSYRGLPALCLPVPSAVVYALACAARLALGSIPVEGRERGGLPMEGRRLGALVTAVVGALLWSGSYVLLDVRVLEAQLGMRIRVI